jgi:hypothetical protein
MEIIFQGEFNRGAALFWFGGDGQDHVFML